MTDVQLAPGLPAPNDSEMVPDSSAASPLTPEVPARSEESDGASQAERERFAAVAPASRALSIERNLTNVCGAPGGRVGPVQ